MNNLLSYCGLVDARISASEKDLPVIKIEDCRLIDINALVAYMKFCAEYVTRNIPALLFKYTKVRTRVKTSKATVLSGFWEVEHGGSMPEMGPPLW